MKIEDWQDLIPLLNKGIEEIHGQNWPESEMVIELKDGSQINFQFILAINPYGICGDIEITYNEPWEEEIEQDITDVVEALRDYKAGEGISVLELHERMRKEGKL